MYPYDDTNPQVARVRWNRAMSEAFSEGRWYAPVNFAPRDSVWHAPHGKQSPQFTR